MAIIKSIFLILFFIGWGTVLSQTTGTGSSAQQAPQANTLSQPNALQQGSLLNPAGGLIPGQGQQNVTSGIPTNKVDIDGNNQAAAAQNAAQADAIVRQERADPNRKERPIDVTNPNSHSTSKEDLTDAERVLSKEFVHDGLAQREFDEPVDVKVVTEEFVEV